MDPTDADCMEPRKFDDISHDGGDESEESASNDENDESEKSSSNVEGMEECADLANMVLGHGSHKAVKKQFLHDHLGYRHTTVGDVEVVSVELATPMMEDVVDDYIKALRFLRVVVPKNVCLRQINGSSVRRLKVDAGDHGIRSFKGIAALFPSVEEFHYHGEWAEPGSAYDMRGLASWSRRLRSLDLRLFSGLETMAHHGPAVLADFQVLAHVRLGYFRTSTKDIAALGKLACLQSLIFWGSDDCYENEKNPVDALDLSNCKRLVLFACREMSFCTKTDQTYEGIMALRLPSTIREVVIVNDSGPLGGLTPALRNQMKTRMPNVMLREYAPTDPMWRRKSSANTSSIVSSQTGIHLWDVCSSFKACNPAEMDAARGAEISRQKDFAEQYNNKNLQALAKLGVSPSADGPFSLGESVWWVDYHCPHPHRSLKRGVVVEVPVAESDPEFAHDDASAWYKIALEGERVKSFAEAPAYALYRSPPQLSHPSSSAIESNSYGGSKRARRH